MLCFHICRQPGDIKSLERRASANGRCERHYQNTLMRMTIPEGTVSPGFDLRVLERGQCDSKGDIEIHLILFPDSTSEDGGFRVVSY